MHQHRTQLIIISMATLILAGLLLLSSLITFRPLILFFVTFLFAISLLADSLVLYSLFRKQDGIIQFTRGILLLCLFFILLFNYILKTF